MSVIRLKEVLQITKCSKSHWYSQIRNGSAPKPIKLGERAVAWVLDDVTKWLEQRIKMSKEDHAA